LVTVCCSEATVVAQAQTQYNPAEGLKFYIAVDAGRAGFDINEKLVL